MEIRRRRFGDYTEAWLRSLEREANRVGDQVGPNEPSLANLCWDFSAELKRRREQRNA